MSGYYQGIFCIGSPEVFFDEVRDNPSPAETSQTYLGEITTVEECGDCASVTLMDSDFFYFILK